jgi:hypothetical protein
MYPYYFQVSIPKLYAHKQSFGLDPVAQIHSGYAVPEYSTVNLDS